MEAEIKTREREGFSVTRKYIFQLGGIAPTYHIGCHYKGKVTAAIAKAFAESEFEKFRVLQDRTYQSERICSVRIFLIELQLPQAELSVIKNSGHEVNIDAPKDLGKALSTFFNL